MTRLAHRLYRPSPREPEIAVPGRRRQRDVPIAGLRVPKGKFTPATGFLREKRGVLTVVVATALQFNKYHGRSPGSAVDTIEA